MKTSARFAVSAVAAVVLGLAATSSVYAIPVISNGGFESGLTSWTKADQLGSDGTFSSQSGTLSPVNGDPVRVWVSAIVDGVETNGVPLTIVLAEHTHAGNAGGNGHAQPAAG